MIKHNYNSNRNILNSIKIHSKIKIYLIKKNIYAKSFQKN